MSTAAQFPTSPFGQELNEDVQHSSATQPAHGEEQHRQSPMSSLPQPQHGFNQQHEDQVR